MFTKRQFRQKKTTWLTFLGVLVAGTVFTVFYVESPWFIAAVIFTGFITGIAVMAIAMSRKKAKTGHAGRRDSAHRDRGNQTNSQHSG